MKAASLQNQAGSSKDWASRKKPHHQDVDKKNKDKKFADTHFNEPINV